MNYEMFDSITLISLITTLKGMSLILCRSVHELALPGQMVTQCLKEDFTYFHCLEFLIKMFSIFELDNLIEKEYTF